MEIANTLGTAHPPSPWATTYAPPNRIAATMDSPSRFTITIAGSGSRDRAILRDGVGQETRQSKIGDDRQHHAETEEQSETSEVVDRQRPRHDHEPQGRHPGRRDPPAREHATPVAPGARAPPGHQAQCPSAVDNVSMVVLMSVHPLLSSRSHGRAPRLFLPDLPVGGVETVMLALARGLSRRPFVVDLVVTKARRGHSSNACRQRSDSWIWAQVGSRPRSFRCRNTCAARDPLR